MPRPPSPPADSPARREIHPTTLVDPSATIAHGVQIGPFCIIGPDVHIGPDTKLIASVTILGYTTLGARCTVYPTAVLGGPAQHGTWAGGAEARVVIGDDVLIREAATIHRSTHGADRPTRVGNRVFLMAGTHIAHDCQVGDDVILVNGTGLAGHVVVGRGAIIAGHAGVAQGVRVGDWAFVAAGTKVSRDVLPFSMVKGFRARTVGTNVVGLRRRGWENLRIGKMVGAIAMVMRNDVDGLEELGKDETVLREVETVLAFWRATEKGICLSPGVPGTPSGLNKL